MMKKPSAAAAEAVTEDSAIQTQPEDAAMEERKDAEMAETPVLKKSAGKKCVAGGKAVELEEDVEDEDDEEDEEEEEDAEEEERAPISKKPAAAKPAVLKK